MQARRTASKIMQRERALLNTLLLQVVEAAFQIGPPMPQSNSTCYRSKSAISLLMNEVYLGRTTVHVSCSNKDQSTYRRMLHAQLDP